MRISYYTMLLICILSVCCSCATFEHISIDYLVPADVSFPPEIRRVGIVNNVIDLPEPDDKESVTNKLVRETTILNGNPEITTNSLAEAIAAENYFDQVIICDSALRANDFHAREATLGRDEVNELADNLQVDMLIALEHLQIRVARKISFLYDWEAYLGSVDAKVYPTIRLYIPNRSVPLATISSKDSIFWEDVQRTELAARTRIISDEALVEEASEYAGSIPIRHIIPHWKTAVRPFYPSGSPEMRDAAVFVRQNDWEKALPYWEKAYQSKSDKKRMRAAQNISLYYEIKDDLEKAAEWGQIALKLAEKVEKIDSAPNKTRIQPESNYYQIFYSLADQTERKSQLSQLNLQMERFNGDF